MLGGLIFLFYNHIPLSLIDEKAAFTHIFNTARSVVWQKVKNQAQPQSKKHTEHKKTQTQEKELLYNHDCMTQNFQSKKSISKVTVLPQQSMKADILRSVKEKKSTDSVTLYHQSTMFGFVSV